jgi:hypothetical protein
LKARHDLASAAVELEAGREPSHAFKYPEADEASLDASLQSASDESSVNTSRAPAVHRIRRILFMGRTPSKHSKTGRKVVERMRAEGKIQGEGPLLPGNPNNLKVLGRDLQWYDIDHTVDMAHKVDAISWWNEVGRQKGARTQEVRKFMLDSDNYHLEPQKFNRSDGAKLHQVYLPPTPKTFNDKE